MTSLGKAQYWYAVVVLLFTLGGSTWQVAQSANAEVAETPAETAPLKPKDRQREGTELVDVLGRFKLTGDRATFYPSDSSARFGGLENLTLERVSTVIAEDPTPMEWIVSGKITEFKGNNYILVTRAILKKKAPPQQPYSSRP